MFVFCDGLISLNMMSSGPAMRSLCQNPSLLKAECDSMVRVNTACLCSPVTETGSLPGFVTVNNAAPHVVGHFSLGGSVLVPGTQRRGGWVIWFQVRFLEDLLAYVPQRLFHLHSS